MANILFSQRNPLFRAAERAHYRLFDMAEQGARLHIDMAGEAIELNRQSLDAFYSSETLKESYFAHKALISDAGELAGRYASGLKDLAGTAIRGNRTE
jgi:hypothetical protein